MKNMRKKIQLFDEKLPYPTRPLKLGSYEVEEYVIPEDKKLVVLKKMYIFQPLPSLDDERIDGHIEKKFR